MHEGKFSNGYINQNLRFTIDAESELQSRSWSRGLPSPDDEREADTKLSEVLAFLAQR